MRAKFLLRMILLGAFAVGVYPQLQVADAAQGQTSAAPESSGTAHTKNKGSSRKFPRRHLSWMRSSIE
jgi:hypothetical protein